MRIALTRAVSPGIARCVLTHLERQPMDYAKAVKQHRGYEECLARLGARVISLHAEPDLPDSVFVEDTAIVLDEIAILLPMGVASRRGETPSVAAELARFRPLEKITLPGTMEGGDVLRIGRRLYVGQSRRTNAEGIRQLGGIVARLGYEVRPVGVTGCLHLKSACTYLGRNTVLGHRQWISARPFREFGWIEVPAEEPAAANTITMGDTVILPASFPRTRALLEQRGFRVESLDISELQKAEAGLTCSSLVFDDTCTSPG